MDLKTDFEIIEKAVSQDRITIDDQAIAIEASNRVLDAILQIEVYVPEPEVPEVPDAPDPNVDTLIIQKDFKGTGLGRATIADLDEQGILTVEQLVNMGLDGINEISGVSDSEAEKIWKRANEILGL